jgi:hypothetical protein
MTLGMPCDHIEWVFYSYLLFSRVFDIRFSIHEDRGVYILHYESEVANDSCEIVKIVSWSACASD